MDATGTPATQVFIQKEARYGARNYAPVPVVVDHARDCLVWDVEGREYIDMMSAYFSVSHGHLHPRVVAAAQRQLEKVAVMSRAYYGTTLGPLLEKLAGHPLTPAFSDWRPGDQRIYVSDIRKAQADLGWTPQVSPEEGVERLWEWIQANIHLFK